MKGGSCLRSQPVVAGPEHALGLVPPRPGVCRLPTSGQTFSGLTASLPTPTLPSSAVLFFSKDPGIPMTWTPGLYTGYVRGQGEARETKVAWGVVDRPDQLVGLEPTALLKGGVV